MLVDPHVAKVAKKRRAPVCSQSLFSWLKPFTNGSPCEIFYFGYWRVIPQQLFIQYKTHFFISTNHPIIQYYPIDIEDIPYRIGLPIIFMVNLQQGILFINTQRSSARRNRSASWWSLGVQGFFRGTRGSRKRWKPGLTWKITSDLIVKGTKKTRRIYYIHRKNNNLN